MSEELANKENESLFEQIKHIDENGIEYWQAGQLSKTLGYSDFRNFVKVLQKAAKACEQSKQELSDHLVEFNEVIDAGKGAKQVYPSYKLSRYFCYLIVQNADSSKEVVALGQTYFAVKTRLRGTMPKGSKRMKKITEISICNFRSFQESQAVVLANGLNIFMYGENGSGKSSFCKALDVFFEASDKRKTSLLLNKFRNRFNDKKSELKIVINSKEEIIYNENGYTGSPKTILHTRRLKGFLEYKNLLPIYLYNYNRKNNLFRFFVEGPLAKLRNPITNKLVISEWEGSKKNKLPREFYDGVSILTQELQEDINKMLKYFYKGLSINLKTSKTWTTGKVYLEVVLPDGYIVENYGQYFNEARLVALAISIYLAVILKYKREHFEENMEGINMLILDDIFIGMDLGNRIPLLSILQKEFKDFHLIVTTHDKHWFELSQKYLDSKNWKFAEVFLGKNINGTPQSVIHDISSNDYLAKAWFYFDKNDYAACANYQRKTLEKKVKKLLPSHLLYTATDTGAIRKNEKTITNYDRLISYLDNAGVDTSMFIDFKIYSKVILNPLSHDNSGSPVFKREVESVFEIIKGFENIKNEIIRKVSGIDELYLNISIQDNNTDWYNYKYIQLDNLRKIWQGTEVFYGPCRIQQTKYKINKEGWITSEDSQPLEIKEAFKELVAKHGITDGNFAEYFKSNKGIKISDMIE